MKFISFLTALIACLISVSVVAGTPTWAKSSGWKDIGIAADFMGVNVEEFKNITDNTTLAYWAGEATAFFWNASSMEPSKMKLRVTWTSKEGVRRGS